jgi:hypothetical protein
MSAPAAFSDIAKPANDVSNSLPSPQFGIAEEEPTLTWPK